MEKTKTVVTPLKLLHQSFIWPVLGFIIAGSAIFLFADSHRVSVWVNSLHTPYGDRFFAMATWLGDGITAAVLIVVLMFIRFSWSFLLAIAMLLSTLLAQWLKHFFNADRPALELADLSLHFVEGVKLYHHFSFPSGHTTAAFCMYGMLAFFSRYVTSRILFFAIAVTVGISRIYLMQHFLEDVLFGAFLGTTIAWLTMVMFSNRAFLQTPAWQSSLWSVIRKK